MVTNPTPGGGASTPIVFTVTNPAPTITSLNPAAIRPNYPGTLNVTITGSGFVSGSSGSSVSFNGQPATSFTVH